MDRLDAMNWRLIDDADIYWIDEMVPTPARDVLQSEPSEAVKNYLKKEQEQCVEKLASKTNSSTRRLPACPCISPDLRTSGVFEVDTTTRCLVIALLLQIRYVTL